MQPRAMRRAWREDERFRARRRIEHAPPPLAAVSVEGEPNDEPGTSEPTMKEDSMTTSHHTIVKVSTYVRQVHRDGEIVGTLHGDFVRGFTARAIDGGRLGFFPPNDPECRDKAIAAITGCGEVTEAAAIDNVRSILGGKVIAVVEDLAHAA